MLRFSNIDWYLSFVTVTLPVPGEPSYVFVPVIYCFSISIAADLKPESLLSLAVLNATANAFCASGVNLPPYLEIIPTICASNSLAAAVSCAALAELEDADATTFAKASFCSCSFAIWSSSFFRSASALSLIAFLASSLCLSAESF